MRATIQLATFVVTVGCASVPHVGEVSHDIDAQRVTLETGCGDEASDALSIEGAELRGETLLLDVTHAGGCEAHTYRICGAREVLETEPGQWVLTVLHDARGDTCEEVVQRVLEVRVDRQRPVNVSNLHERSVTVWVR